MPTIYRSRTHPHHYSLRATLTDLAIGLAAGFPLAVLLWIATLWWLADH